MMKWISKNEQRQHSALAESEVGDPRTGRSLESARLGIDHPGYRNASADAQTLEAVEIEAQQRGIL